MILPAFGISSSTSISSSGTINYPPTGKLHVDGRYIKDQIGSVVYLRGVDRMWFAYDATGFWQPEGGDYRSGLWEWNPDAVRAHLRAMNSWGINCMRLCINVQWWIDRFIYSPWKDTTFDYRQNIKDTIAMADEQGIYVVFAAFKVMRDEDGGSADPAAPYPPHINALEEAYIPSEQAFVDFWVAVAQELKGYSNVIFDLWNEPRVISWFDVAQRCVDAIRTVTNHIIIVNSDVWLPGDTELTFRSFLWVEKYPVTGSNIVYDVHLYRYWNAWGSDQPYDYATIKEIFEGIEGKAVKHVVEDLDKCVYISETGAYQAYTGQELVNELEAFRNFLSICNEWEIGYLVWEWFPMTAGAPEWPNQAMGILRDSAEPQVSGPNEAGQILIDAIKAGA